MTQPSPNEKRLHSSPPWGATTKLVVALTFVAILAGLFIRFHTIVGPLLMAFVLAYLLYPVAGLLRRGLRISWQLAVAVLYALLLVFLLGLLTVGGLGLVQQIQSLLLVIEENLKALPDVLQRLSGQVYPIGPLQIDLRALDLRELSNQLLGVVQPLLGRTGTLLGAVASGAAEFLGWTLFVLVVSYFILAESGGLPGHMFSLDIPGYADDIRRLGYELSQIWNAFLRGQIIIFFLTAAVYMIALTLLGVRFAIGIAFLAGLARFVPYVGPLVTWITLALVAYFQSFRLGGLSPLAYTLAVVITALLLDQVLDNLVTPRIIARSLRVHPAAVLVAAIIAANLVGLFGVVIAAPILATAMLLWRYTLRKMLDLDPWPEPPTQPPRPLAAQLFVRLRRLWHRVRRRLVKPG